MDIYLDKIYKATGGDVLRFDSVKEAYAKLVQKRITTGSSRVFVVRDDKYFFKADNQWGKVLLYGGCSQWGSNCYSKCVCPSSCN